VQNFLSLIEGIRSGADAWKPGMPRRSPRAHTRTRKSGKHAQRALARAVSLAVAVSLSVAGALSRSLSLSALSLVRCLARCRLARCSRALSRSLALACAVSLAVTADVGAARSSGVHCSEGPSVFLPRTCEIPTECALSVSRGPCGARLIVSAVLRCVVCKTVGGGGNNEGC
jgi:hypothetical protein